MPCILGESVRSEFKPDGAFPRRHGTLVKVPRLDYILGFLRKNHPSVRAEIREGEGFFARAILSRLFPASQASYMTSCARLSKASPSTSDATASPRAEGKAVPAIRDITASMDRGSGRSCSVSAPTPKASPTQSRFPLGFLDVRFFPDLLLRFFFFTMRFHPQATLKRPSRLQCFCLPPNYIFPWFHKKIEKEKKIRIRITMEREVEARTSGEPEQGLSVSEYTPRRVFPFRKEGPGGVVFPDEEVRMNESSSKLVSFCRSESPPHCQDGIGRRDNKIFAKSSVVKSFRLYAETLEKLEPPPVDITHWAIDVRRKFAQKRVSALKPPLCP